VSTLLVPWLVYPALLGAVSFGCGLLLERVSGLGLSGTLVVPCGFAVLALVAQLAVMTSITADLATPAVLVVAAAGFAGGRPLRRLRVDWPAASAAAGSLAAYAAPIVLSGAATFAGYIKLDDDSTLVALVDRAMDHGRDVSGLAPSTYLRVVDLLLDEGYPLASLLPMGVGGEILREDILWLYQPTMAFMAAMLALGLYELAGKVVEAPWLRALAAWVGAQSALLYGYALWGGIKEMGTAWALPVLAALVPAAARSERARELIPLAAVSALVLGVLNAGALVWLAPSLGIALFMLLRERGVRGALRPVGAFTGFLALFALPTIVSAPAFLTSNIVSYDPIANLGAPLDPLQIAGIWPAGDFRDDPDPAGAAAKALVLVAILAAAAAVAWALRRREWAIPLYVCGAVGSALILWAASTPWIEGKAFATAAPAIPFAAVLFGALLARSGRVAEGVALGTIVVGGVLWSNVLQYHDVWLGPRDQLAELERIGSRFAGDGPALMTEYQPYGVRHFLRRLDAEGASELRVRPVPLRNGRVLDKGATANIDDFDQAALRVYRTLVLRRSPTDSRPPSDYRLVSSGRWYDVWQRDGTSSQVLEHVPLGDGAQPAAVPDCSEVARLARVAGPNGRLAAVELPATVVVPTYGAMGDVTVGVPVGGPYGIWMGGSIRNRLQTAVDGEPLADVRYHLDYPGQFMLLGMAELTAGRHEISLRHSNGGLRPGSGVEETPVGPLVLSPATPDAPVTIVPVADARRLCGKRLDWVEALR
jgi:hypothetical protein